MEETKPKPFVFVLMPFSEPFTDIYEVGIKAACKDAGAYCERVDEQIFVETILERVYNQIAKADVVVAEMTGRNPNVFYEVGYAHALSKRVILLTQNSDDIPFDLKQYPHIVYGGKISLLKSQLEAKVRWCIENPKKPLSLVATNLQFFINGMSLLDEPEIETPLTEIRVGFEKQTGISLNISVYNAANISTDYDSFRVALTIPSTVRLSADSVDEFIRSVIQHPDGRMICNLTMRYAMFPRSWESLTLNFPFDEKDLPDSPLHMTLSLLTETGPTDYPFKIRVVR